MENQFIYYEEKIKHLENLLDNSLKEVEELQNLLRECKKIIIGEMDDTIKNIYYNKLKGLLTRINAAIGESEE